MFVQTTPFHTLVRAYTIICNNCSCALSSITPPPRHPHHPQPGQCLHQFPLSRELDAALSAALQRHRLPPRTRLLPAPGLPRLPAPHLHGQGEVLCTAGSAAEDCGGVLIAEWGVLSVECECGTDSLLFMRVVHSSLLFVQYVCMYVHMIQVRIYVLCVCTYVCMYVCTYNYALTGYVNTTDHWEQCCKALTSERVQRCLLLFLSRVSVLTQHFVVIQCMHMSW